MRVIFAMPGNEAFAKALAEAGGFEPGVLETRRFPDGESYVRLLTDVRGKCVDLICSLADPNEGFLSLVFAADAARDLGAREVTLVAPYLSYMRQDRRFQSGEAVSSRSFARLVSATFDRLVTVDPHLHRYPALSTLYTIPDITLNAAPVLADWIAAHVEAPLLIGPDEESEQWVSVIAARIGAPFTVLRKVRHGDRSVDVEVPDLGAWSGRQPVLVDDIASSGRTMIEAARKLVLQEFPKPVCAVIHGIFAEDSYERLAALSSRIVSTDAVPHPSNAIGLAPLLAEALAKAHADTANLTRHRRPPEPFDEGDGGGDPRGPTTPPPAN